MSKAKPFVISKWSVWEAYKRVKANRGAAGVDDQSIEEFERNLRNNLYKLWNRMSSGSYFPPPVKRVEIEKSGGGMRPLGIPTVADRIAQAVVKGYLEPMVEPHFHADSYGYRPGKSALEALGVTRERCWRYDWVVDVDIKAFFDTIDHDLLMRAVRKHTDSRWVLLYIERWLKAPVQMTDGTLQSREKGTPQGSVISPLLANLFLHYAFDRWMEKYNPSIPFERFADDIVCHCRSEAQAKWLRARLECRFAECGLELHLQKTRIVYCKDDNRRECHSNEKFDFLGYTFRPRRAKSKRGEYFVSFLPAASNAAHKSLRQTIRSWHLHRCSGQTLDDFACMINPILEGWINYYGHFYKSSLYPTFRHLDFIMVRWARRKYKRFRGSQRKARGWLRSVRSRQPSLFAHWRLLYPCAGR